MDSARSRQEKKDLELCEHIVKRLSGDGRQRVELTGKSGIGKTHLARMVGEHATKKGLCYLALLLHLNHRFEDEMSLYENIAFQIEAYDREEEEANASGMLQDLKEKISTELSNRKKTSEDKVPYLLLILDDEGNKTSEDKVMKDLGLGSFLKHELNLKILITRRREGNTTECDEKIKPSDLDETHDTRCHGEIVFHSTDESEALSKTLTKEHLHDLFESLITDEAKHLLESLHKDCKIDEPLTSCVVQKSMGLPAAVAVFAKSLNCITNTFKSFSPKVKEVLKEVLFRSEPACANTASDSTLHLAYALLETDTSSKNAIFDCFWHSLDFFKYIGCVHYAELITQWILEGYFDPVRSVKKAYKDGHDILLLLINRGFLKMQEGDMIVPEMVMDNLINLRHHGLSGRSQVRLSRGYGCNKYKGLGKITQIDDMIKTVHSDRVCTLLVCGNRLRRDLPLSFFKQMKDLEVVGLFNPTVDHLIPALKSLQKLRVLVIRGFDLLSDIEELQVLRLLEVLEVSGASSVKAISDDFFLEMPNLQSLNLSGLGIINSPSSISELTELHTLILRDCPLLEALPDIQRLTTLEIFDVSGCTKLHTIEGSFADMSFLREVNLSGTRIETVPGLPEKSSICCLKLVVLPDSKRVKHDTWSQVKKAVICGLSESLSPSENESGDSGQVDLLWAFDCPEKKGGRGEHFHQGQIYRNVYMKTVPFVDTTSCQKVLKIQGCNGADEDKKKTLAEAQFVAFVDNTAASLSSTFNHLKSVKGCWLEMCCDIEILFSGADEERFENLETLSVRNLGRLESICSSGFKNLKQLSLDCCPHIETLFPYPPTSLEVLKIKFCEKLEKVLEEEEAELPNLHTLCLFELPVLSTIGAKLPNLVTYKYRKCPQLKLSRENIKGF